MRKQREPGVLIVTGEYPPAVGGVGDYTRLLATGLSDLGLGVTVLTGAARGVTAKEEAGLAVERDVPGWGLRSWGAVARAAARAEADIVHLQYQAAAYELRGAANLLPAYLRVRMPRARVVTTFHDLLVPYLFPKAGPLRRLAVRALDAFSDRTVLTNAADLNAMGGEAAGKRRLIPIGSNIPNAPPGGFDRDEWRRSMLDADGGTPVLAYFGLVNQSKGIDLVVEALSLLLARGIPAKLAMIGGAVGETDPTNRALSRQMGELVERLRVGSRVIRTGVAGPSEVSAYLLAADVCVLPFRDGASLRRGSLLAALEHGCPTVTTCPSSPEPLLANEGNVLMVPRSDAAAIADAVQRLWKDPSLRNALSTGARSLSAQFQWPEIAKRHAELYESLRTERRRPGE